MTRAKKCRHVVYAVPLDAVLPRWIVRCAVCGRYRRKARTR